MKTLTEILKKFDEMCDHSPDSYYEGFVGKNKTKYENVISGKKSIKSFIREAIVSALEECKPPKKVPDCSENDKNECTVTCGWNAAVDEYKKKIKEFLK